MINNRITPFTRAEALDLWTRIVAGWADHLDASGARTLLDGIPNAADAGGSYEGVTRMLWGLGSWLSYPDRPSRLTWRGIDYDLEALTGARADQRLRSGLARLLGARQCQRRLGSAHRRNRAGRLRPLANARPHLVQADTTATSEHRRFSGSLWCAPLGVVEQLGALLGAQSHGAQGVESPPRPDADSRSDVRLSRRRLLR